MQNSLLLLLAPKKSPLDKWKVSYHVDYLYPKNKATTMKIDILCDKKVVGVLTVHGKAVKKTNPASGFTEEYWAFDGDTIVYSEKRPVASGSSFWNWFYPYEEADKVLIEKIS